MKRLVFAVLTLGFLTLAQGGANAQEVPPPNDQWENREVLTGQNARAEGTNVGATKQEADPAFVANIPTEHTVWYSWTAPVSGPVRINTCNANYDSVLGVFQGDSLGTLVEGVSNDDDCGFLGSAVSFNAAAGQTYHILVDGYYGAVGNFTLGVDLYNVINCRTTQDVCSGTGENDRMFGTRAEDDIRSGGGNDQVYGLASNDVLIGGGGHDGIQGYKGRDKLYGGEGNDTIRTGEADGARDTVQCGGGWDRVYKESSGDAIAADCEEVLRAF